MAFLFWLPATIHLPMLKDYVDINRKSWNSRVDTHYDSDFYDVKSFIAGETSLNSIELDLLNDIQDKSVLHLQCHFGQDTISLARMGAQATGIDLSDKAIDKAIGLAQETSSDCRFICCDVYDLPNHLEETFDIVFVSYGTIGWLPDIDRWADVIAHYLKPGGQLVFVEFHPVVWMFDDYFKTVAYRYFNSGPIHETEEGTYADKQSKTQQEFVMWNHGLAEVMTSLINKGLTIKSFQEYDYSPYDCFRETMETEPGKYQIATMGDKLPMVYSVVAEKPVG